jgi:hypothetical protein
LDGCPGGSHLSIYQGAEVSNQQEEEKKRKIDRQTDRWAFSFTLRPNSSQTISSWLRWGIVEARSFDAALHQIALTQLGGVFGHCPVKKQMIVGLCPNQMGWRIAAECCGSPAG